MTDKEAHRLIDALDYFCSNECCQYNPAYSKAVRIAALALRDRIKGGWISVEDRLPKEMDLVIIHQQNGLICCAEYFKNWRGVHCWAIDDCWLTNNVTHWQPLPAPPEDFSHE